jgi:DNA-binding GntR family transcriptional regulator
MEAPITHTRLDTAVDEHRAIIAALEAGDADLARERLESHILRVRDQTIVFLTQPRMNLGRR